MRAQARGDGEAMLRLLAACSTDPRCATRVRANGEALAGAAVLAGLPADALGALARPADQKLCTDASNAGAALGARWLRRRDRVNVGQRRHFERQRGAGGWSPITVPNAWNAGDDS